jgi:hypothetical protein
MSVPDFLRQQVVTRADNRCEYCGLAQAGQEAPVRLASYLIHFLRGIFHYAINWLSRG